MEQAVAALNQALTDLTKDRDRLEQALSVALNERNGRAEDIQSDLVKNEQAGTRIRALINELLEEI